MKVLVTGATGFIGSHLTDKLLDEGFDVFCTIRETSSLRRLEGKKINFIKSENIFEDKNTGKNTNFDYIFHCAGIVKAKNYSGYEKGNYLLTKRILEETYKYNPNLKKFIHISSQAACGPSPDREPINEEYSPKPITRYGTTKLMAEKEVFKYKDKFPVVIVRPSAVFGERDTEILMYFKFFNKGINSLIGFGEKYLSLIYIKDLTEGIFSASHKETESGEIFFLSSDRQYSWDEISDVTSKILNRKSMKLRIPHFFLYSAGAVYQFFSLFSKNAPTLNIEKCKDLTQRYWTCSNAKAKRILGFRENYTLEQSFRNTINWYKQNKWI